MVHNTIHAREQQSSRSTFRGTAADDRRNRCAAAPLHLLPQQTIDRPRRHHRSTKTPPKNPPHNLQTAWLVACSVALAYALPRLDAEGHSAKLLWTFFQPVAPPLLMLWLWSRTVGYFEARRISYAACFSLRDQRRLPSAAGLRQVGGGRGCIGHPVVIVGMGGGASARRPQPDRSALHS